ncbi:MAG: family 78 glycoside hydrolase catalytic domain [Mycobacteriales bacterium]
MGFQRLAALRLRCNHLDAPLVIGPEPPLLSWQIASDQRGVEQTGYRLRVASTVSKLTQPDVWDSGPVSSDDQRACYRGPDLESRAAYHWSVQVSCGTAGEATSAPASFEAGLLRPSDWRARWITLPRPADDHDDFRPAPYLRREFLLTTQPARARLYVTAAGLYEAYVNGTRVGDGQLTPGWTDFRRRVHYQGYDVTELLRPGRNALAAVIADGWYSGYIGWGHQRAHYGSQPALLAQLVVEDSDGIATVVATDSRWRAAFGPMLASDLQMGETYDARRELAGWNQPGFGKAGWVPATVTAGPAGILTGQPCLPPRVVTELTPTASADGPPGSRRYDLGQNMVGRVRLQLTAPAGTIVRIRHGEVLTADGELYTQNLRQARATDTYVAAGRAGEVWEPQFTLHGFRHVEVTGAADVTSLSAVVVSSAGQGAGEFDCSEPLLCQLQSNIRWSLFGNVVEVPTDCPQRDERLGWLGDAQVFAPTACYNADLAGFYAKWLTDVMDAQRGDGAFSDVAPLPVQQPGLALGEGAPGWGDAGVIVAWTVFHVYDDPLLLSRVYRAARAWADFLHAHNPDLIRSRGLGNNYGDWLAVDADTPKEVLATCYFAHSARLVARMAEALGRTADATAYHRLARDVAAAFRRSFVDSGGRVHGDTQTGYVLALEFDLLTGRQRRGAVAHLVADIETRGNRLSTGFLGVAHLLDVLTAAGRLDLAYRLALSEKFPSWGYAIRHGATTMWERWDGWTERDGFQTPAMNSFNHYALGSVGAWLFAVVGGLRADPGSAGWRRVIVQPRPGGGLTWARVRYESVRGSVGCHWRYTSVGLAVTVEIPAGCSAEVVLPIAAGQRLTEQGRPVQGARVGAGTVRAQVGSGEYEFLVS